MGFWKSTGKLGLDSLRGIGNVSIEASKLGIKVAEVIGKPTAHFMGKSPGKFASAVGIGALAGAIGADAANEDPSKGAAAIGTAAFAASSFGAAGAIGSMGAAAVGTAAAGVGIMGKIGSSMIDVGKGNKGINFSNLNELKINGKGIAAMAAVGAVGGLLSANKKFEKSRMGTNDGMLRSATPIVPMPQQDSYSNYGDGGATGDLVFAMHNNR